MLAQLQNATNAVPAPTISLIGFRVWGLRFRQEDVGLWVSSKLLPLAATRLTCPKPCKWYRGFAVAFIMGRSSPLVCMSYVQPAFSCVAPTPKP